MDREARLYAATHMGVQVFDRNGRVRVILHVPGSEVTNLRFGGINFGTLPISCDDHGVPAQIDAALFQATVLATEVTMPRALNRSPT
jgi:sugar lactone lactonase YvrE